MVPHLGGPPDPGELVPSVSGGPALHQQGNIVGLECKHYFRCIVVCTISEDIKILCYKFISFKISTGLLLQVIL